MDINKANIVPALRYRNAPKAIDWLCAAFGFEKQAVIPGENGTIVHAQLTLGNGMIMLGPVTPGEYGKLTKQPDEIGGAVTQSAYIIVPDADAHYKQAKAEGRTLTDDDLDQIRNICRCGTYSRIRAAIKAGAQHM